MKKHYAIQIAYITEDKIPNVLVLHMTTDDKVEAVKLAKCISDKAVECLFLIDDDNQFY